MKSKYGGHLNHLIKLYNGRLFNHLLSERKDIIYNAEQGKILSCLRDVQPLSAVELTKVTGLSKTTLSAMLKRLEAQGLISSHQDVIDSRKKQYTLTQLGVNQCNLGEEVSQILANIFYQGFNDHEIQKFEHYLERIKDNLQTALENKSIHQ